MIVVLFSYILMLYISLGLGLMMQRWLALERYNILFSILAGLFVLLNLSTFYALFLPIDFKFFVITLFYLVYLFA